MELSMPSAVFRIDESDKKEATEVMGEITLKLLCPINLWLINNLSRSIWVSKSVPPIDNRLPSAYLILNMS